MNSELMMQSLNDGLMISIIGMLVVMFFLSLMMWIMKFNEQIMFKLNEIFPEEVAETPKKTITKSSANNELAVAVAAARKFFAKGGN